MVGKVIEKTFKYTIPTPNELFQILKENFSKATLPDRWFSGSSQSWTTSVLGIFDEVGRSLGYMPRKEYLRLDQTWEIRLPDISTIVLALECENTDRVEEILGDELQKLLDVKGLLKVLVFYPGIPMYAYEGETLFPDIEEKIGSAGIKNPDERYIVMTIVYVRPQSIIEVCACSFDSEGKPENLGCFQVKYTSKD